jgi:uncharacterized membrane protein YfcA
MIYLLFLLIGAVSGLLSGMLGIGGGVIIIPCLVYLFEFINIPSSDLMQMALGTSISAVVLNTLFASRVHIKNKNYLEKPLKVLIASVIFGSIIGAIVAKYLPSLFLKEFFAFFEIAIGFFIFYQKINEEGDQHNLPRSYKLFFIGTAVSFLSSILGIAGGVIMVPLLMHYRVPMRKAVGTSTITSVFIALVGGLIYGLAGINKITVPYSFGFIYLPAFACIALGSVFSASYGAKLVLKLPVKILKRFFGLILIGIGIVMIIV